MVSCMHNEKQREENCVMKVYLFVGAWMFIGYMIAKLSEKL